MITGGSRGLGLALAREFARRGSRIAVCAGNESELAKVRKEFEESGVPFTAFQCDVGNRAEIQRTVAMVEQHLGPIDVLVNNAGTMIIGPVENQDLEAFEDAMQTNFWGAVYATLAVSEGMKRRGAGRIVNIASIGGKVAFPHLLPYSASKFALVGYSEGLRSELVKDNIFVTTACPGLMRAGNTRNDEFAGQQQKDYAWFAVSDSVPGISMDVRKAARKIVNACVSGESEVRLGFTAKMATLVQAIAPGVLSERLAKVSSTMPKPGQASFHPQKGPESRTAFDGSPLTKLTRGAEDSQNHLENR